MNDKFKILTSLELSIKELDIKFETTNFQIFTDNRIVVKFKVDDDDVNARFIAWAKCAADNGVFETATIISIRGFKEFTGVIISIVNLEITIAEIKPKDSIDDLIKIDKGE